MKTIYNLFVVCLLLTASTLEAQVVRTFSNRDGETSEFNTLQEVIDASADGDFIYVSGSSNSYGDININKRINLIGAGHNPSTADGLRSTLGTVIFQNGSSDSRVAGFTILQASYSGSQINNVIIQRNLFQFNFFIADFQNWIFEENIINSIFSQVLDTFEERFIFRNNIITLNPQGGFKKSRKSS